jgi:hypothetical protein
VAAVAASAATRAAEKRIFMGSLLVVMKLSSGPAAG